MQTRLSCKTSLSGFTGNLRKVLIENYPRKFLEFKTNPQGKSRISKANFCLRYCLGIDRQYLDPLTLVKPSRRMNLEQLYYNNIVAIRTRNPRIQPLLVPLGGSWFLPPLHCNGWLRSKLLAAAWSKGQCNCITLIPDTVQQYLAKPQMLQRTLTVQN